MSAMDSENEQPQPKKRSRGPYKQYLEPGKQYSVPKSTLRSRRKKEKPPVKQQSTMGSKNDDGHCAIDLDPATPETTSRRLHVEQEVSSSDDSESFVPESLISTSMSVSNAEAGTPGQREQEANECERSDSSLEQSDDCGTSSSQSSRQSDNDRSATASNQKVSRFLAAYTSGSISDEEDMLQDSNGITSGNTDDCCSCIGFRNECDKCSQNHPLPDEEHPFEENDPRREEDTDTFGQTNESVSPEKDESPEANSSEEDIRRNEWKQKHKFEERAHPALSATKFEILLMIFHLFISHNLTYAVVEDILKLINCVLGLPALSTSQFLFRKLFRPNCKISTHIYCPECEGYLGEQSKLKGPSVTCACGQRIPVNELQDNYFVTIDVKDSLKYFMQRPDVNLLPPTDRIDGMYTDIMDGDLYQSKIRSEAKNGKNVISLTFNTDGAKVFDTNKKSMWPIQFIINELHPKERFKDVNVFLAGLWYGRGSPNMTTFFKPFCDELISLASRGVELLTSTGSKVLYHVFAPICSVDSGAKPKLARQKAGNGKYGCGFCVHPNLCVPTYPKQQLRFVERVGARRLIYDDRTHESILNDMLKADALDRAGKLKVAHKGTPNETADHVNGMYGISCLAVLPKFDLVRGYVIDYLHTLLLGVMSSLISHLFDSADQRTESHDPASQIPAIEERLSSIKPPNSMAARSRSMHERGDWKGKELRLFALVYVLPCLHDLPRISPKHFKHLQKFVSALQILLGSAIKHEDLVVAERLLDEFVLEFEEIYGPIHMTLNIHLLKHVVSVVRAWGPLFGYSNFAFESGNGRLARLVRGTNGVVTQICEKYLAVLTVNDYLDEYDVSKPVLDFCSDVMSYKYTKNTKKIDDDTRVLGRENVLKLITTDSADRTAIMESGVTSLMEADVVQYYNRVSYKGTVYYSKAYTRPEKFDDTCVKLIDGTFAITQKFIKTSESSDLYVLVRPIKLSVTDEKLAPLIHTGAYFFYDPLKVVEAKMIDCKCACIQFPGHNYVCELPNHFERD